MSKPPLHALLTAVARALQSEQRRLAVAAELPPVQWTILRYLGAANRYSNTPQVLAEYLGQTKGTVSQSIKHLEARGWVERRPDARDGRSVRLFLTPAGRRQLEEDAPAEWREALAALSAAERNATEAGLTKLLGAWQQGRGGRSFGVCRSCRHFLDRPEGYRCGLTGEALSEEDSTRICREHAVAVE